MRDRFADDLAVLTGEQLMNLLNHLHTALQVADRRHFDKTLTPRRRQDAADLIYELEPVREDAMLNLARIQIPMIEAQGIIWRAVFARRRPFRVNPQ
jgi:hypothetical protein